MRHTATCCSQHPLDEASSPTPARSGQVVYVVCGSLGCTERAVVDAATWEAELARRRALSAGVQVWYARGDRLVPVAPDVDGRVPGKSKEAKGG
jgi:hypothetical protein